MATAPAQEIEAFEERFREYVLRDHAPAGLDGLDELARRTNDRLLALSKDALELELSDALRNELRQYLLAALRTLNEIVHSSQADEQRRYAAETLVELEAVRHIFRDAIDHEPLRSTHPDGSAFLSRAGAADQITKWLPRLSRDEQAELLGIEARTLLRWKEMPDAPAPRPAELATELVGILRHSWTNEGVARWFQRSHPLLDGRTPAEVLAEDDPDWEQRLLNAARAGRAQTGT